MSATRSDVSQIQDEDVLRRMWQETEDFGRKKEIRAHMYKIREARLRDFYSSGDDSKDIQRTHSSPGIERKGPLNTHHADSLADHSFLSLKSKEIRDSESPTRDINYKISEKLSQDKGWTVKEKNERSQDGKTFTTSRVATTSGSDKIDGGVANYAAKNEQLASVYQDGDDKNFTKSVGASSKSLIKQEAQGGDENSKFYTSSTSSKSSSKVVTEHKSTSGDDYSPSDPSQTVIRKTYSSNVPEERIYDSTQNVIRKTYTTNVPEELKRQIPNYVEGNTKVYTETKTLPDGSTVTTTRYETTGGKSTTQSSSSSYSTSSKHVSNSEKNYSSNNVSKQEIKSVKNDNRNINDEVDNVRIIRYTQPVEERNVYRDTEFSTVNKTNRTEDVRSFKNEDVRSFRNEDVKTYRNEDVRTSRNEDVRTSRNEDIRTSRNEDVRTSRNEDIRTSRNEYVDVNRSNKVVQETNLQDVKRFDDVNDNRRNTREEIIVTTQPREQVDKNTIIRTTVIKNVGSKVDDRKVISDDFINVERQHIEETSQKPRDQSPVKDNQPREQSPTKTPKYDQHFERSPKSSPQNYEIPRDQSPTKYEQPNDYKPKSDSSPKYEQPERRQPIHPPQSEFDIKHTDTPYETTTYPRYEQPERRQPAKPPKSEMDTKPQPTKGQYDTTYRTEFTTKRITVDVSPTHDAFARSLRSVTPERSSPSRGSVRSLRTSTSSLRSSISPEKNRHPTRYSPDRRAGSPNKPSRSPTKFTSTETITKTNRKSPKRTTSIDTITKRRVHSNSTDIITKTTTKNVEDNVVDTSTLTRRPKRKEVPRSRSTSPTDTVSDFEFISTKHEQVTDLDDVQKPVTPKKDDERPKNLDFSSPRRPKKVTERSPTSPLTDIRKHSPSPTKDSNYPRRSSLKTTPTSPMVSPTKPREDFKPYNPKNKPVEKTDKVLRRTDTYEERCRQILGIVEKKKVEKNITDILFSDRNRPKSPEKKPIKESPRKPSLPDSARRPSPDKFSQSPERKTPGDYGKPRKDSIKSPERPRSVKEVSPERKPLRDSPSQTRKSPEKWPSTTQPGRKSPTKESHPKIQEFPSQIRKSPVKEPLEKYPEKMSPTKDKAPKIQEFPSQIRKSTEREPLEPYPERKHPAKESPKVQEFPSQIRKSPERVPLEPYPERTKLVKDAPTVQEFPSQIRKSPEKTPLEPYPELTKPVKESPKVQEFPSQVRKSPQKEPLEPYSEKIKPTKEAPNVFPSQIKSPDRAPLQAYPELSSPSKVTSKIHEFNNKRTKIYSESSSDEEIRTDKCEPYQVPESQENEPTESRKRPQKDYPETKTSKIQEFPSQTRKSPSKEPLEPYPEKKIPNTETPKIQEFPSQIRKSPAKEPLEPYPEKRKPTEEGPKIKEFPSQNRKVPEKELLEPYPEKQKPTKDSEKRKPTDDTQKIKEFPSQSRKVLEKEPLQTYPQKHTPDKQPPQTQEYLSQNKKYPQKEPQHPVKQSPKKEIPNIQEIPSQNKVTPQKKPLDSYPQTRKSPNEEHPLETRIDRQSPERHYPETEDTPSDIIPEYEPSDFDSPETEPTLMPQKVKPVSVTPEFIYIKPKQPKKHAAEDELLEKTTKYIDGKRVPVDEPLFVQKFISQLGSDDEEEIVTETNITNTKQTVSKTRQSPERPSPVRRTGFEDLESEIIEDEKKETIDYVVDEEVDFIVRKSPERLSPVRGIPNNITQKSVKKDLSRKTQKVTDFITNEKVDTEITLSKITKPKKDVPQTKKTTAKINIVDTRKVKDTKSKTVPIKTTVKEIRLVKPQITTVKVEGVTRVRESRLDTTRRVQNEEIKSPLKPSQPKTKPMEKTVIRKTINEYPSQKRIDRPTPERKNKPDEKKPVQKLIKPKDDAPKMFPRKEFIIDLKPKKPIEKTPKRAVVSTVINLSPKSKTPTRVVKKTVTTTVTKATKTVPTTVKPKIPKGAKPIQNGHVSDEESDVEVIIDENMVTEEVSKISREVSDIIKPSVKLEKTKPKLEKKCVSTKSIIINNTVADQREIIVDLQRSKSSREETPDRVWPVTTEEDSGIPRYPDQIVEPEEPVRKPKRTVDVPLTESEDVTEFSRITEIIDTKVTNLKTDECLLSVNEKVTKFLDSVEGKKPTKPSGPAPKVERPTLVVDENLEEDECLLSVTDKVNKFITTAEKLTLQERPKSPRCQNLPDFEDEKSVTSVSEKVNQFASDKSKPKPKLVAPKVQRPDLTDIDDNLKSDECLLSVSDKVSKFITTAENLTKTEIKRDKSPNKKVSLDDIPTDCPTVIDEDDMFIVPKTKQDEQQKPVKLVEIPKEDHSIYPEEPKYYPKDDAPKEYKPEIPRGLKEDSPKLKQDVPKTFKDLPKDRRESPTRKLKNIVEPKVSIDPSPKTVKQEAPKLTDVTKTRKESPTRRLSDSPRTYGSPKQETPKTTDVPIYRKESPTRKFSQPEDTTPKSTRRPSQEDKVILSSVGRLRSTESIKRARALFENIDKDKPKQRDILSRPSVFEGRKTAKKDEVKLTDIGIEKKHLVEVKKKLTYEEEEEKRVPDVNTPTDKDIPGYMRQLDRSLREKSPRKQNKEEEDKRVPDVITPTDEDIPGYMRQLDRSLREKSPHKQNVLELQEITKGHIPQTEDVKPTKFGVVLKRTDSERKEERRRSSTIVTEIEGVEKEVEIEEVYDLELLEAMLIKVVSYEIRRRIRAQIRTVKKLISENKLHTVTTVKKTTKTTSPTRAPTREKSPEKPQTEYQNKYVRKPSLETKVVNNHLQKHTHLVQEKDITDSTTEYQTSYTYNERRRSSDIRIERREKSPDQVSPTRSKSPFKQTVSKPKSTTTTTTTTTITNLRKSPERKPRPETKIFSTELKKTVPASKTPTEDKPEWAIQRNLKKVNERQVTKAKTVTTNSTVTKKDTKRSSVSPSKDVKTIDVITSSYGVGPTDENGTPLFGLRALRAQNKNDKTKVQGTVMHSTYYSENGEEPVGEISVTKYSTDPADLGATGDFEHTEGLLSKTTTQKFGYKDTPSYKSLTDKKKQVTEKNDEIRTTTTTKVSRRGSVKEMSQKFLDNAVDTLKSERQTSYPKAGLILRTSSFKDTGSGSSREGSPTEGEEYHQTVTVKTSSSTKGNADTFLTNTSKVSNVQDVITRMKTEDIREGESEEDAEARSLLNKFLGSQVILAGMEGHVTRGSTSKSSASASATTSTSSSKRVTKVTSTITENGNPKTTTRTFTHPITSDVLETIWDDQTLKLLLEQSTEYEERRIIRLRLKQVMAEKEACSEFVEKTIEESQTGNVEGESLLLPLLQGVLDAPEFEQTADSGTECGEDLRSGLIVEVQNALDKLSACLCSDSTDITTERRDSLLQLVTKLQANLSTTPQSNSERRLSQGRFSRRRSRQNRHTVGVTSEELEDARRLMEEFALRDTNFTNPLQKQISEGCVLNKQGEYKPVKYQPQQPIKNATAKPFSNSTSQSQSGTSSSVETPTTESLDLLFTEKPEEIAYFSNPTIQKREPKYRHSVSLDQVYNSPKRPLSQTFSLDFNSEVDIKSVQQAVQQAAALKNMKDNESETDEETVTVEKFEPNILKEGETVVLYDQSVYSKNPVEKIIEGPKPDLVLQTNPIYTNTQEEKENISDSEKYNRFNTKKLRMKRANTIDIPKPLNFYQYDDESDGEMTDQEANSRRSTYLALRGPIRIGKVNNNNNTVPSLEPKTESDKKFMAFINKHNESAGVVNKINLWDKTAQSNERGTNWHRKFGNIKTNFENGEERKNVNSARNFWKSADDAVAAGTISYNGPKISRQNARNLQQMFEQKQKQNQIKNGEEKNVVTGSLKVDTKNLEPHKNYKFVPQPLSVNKFSHNPQSAFKPIHKTPIKPENLSFNRQVIKTNSNSDDGTPETPLYLYSPKSFEANSGQNQPPWSAKAGERRVLSLAVSKFENPPPEEPKFKPRKLSKEKVTIPFGLQKVEPKEKLPIYMPPQNAAKVVGSVRKLSGQYDTLGNKINTDYVAQSNVKYVQKPLHQSAFASVPQNRNFGTYEAPKVTNAINFPKPSLPKTTYHPTPKVNKNFENDKSYKSYEQKPFYPPQKLSQTFSNDEKNLKNIQNNYNSCVENNYLGNKLSPTFDTSPQLYNQTYQPPLEQSHLSSYQPHSPKTHQNEHLEPNLDIPEILPSFHTTSPQVQNFQKLHNVDQHNYTQNSYENQQIYPVEQNYSQEILPNYSPNIHPYQQQVEPSFPQNIHPEPHVFYNNVYDQNMPHVNPSRQSQISQSPPLIRPQYDSQVSQESLHEYNAISSKVMSAPVTQLAVTVQQNQPKSRNEHDLDVAFNLKNSLQRKSEERRSPNFKADIKPKSPSFSMGKTVEPKDTVPKVSQSSNAPKPVAPNFFVNDKPLNLESLEINERGESIVTSKFHIPMKGVDKKPSLGQSLSKSDSWHQICQENQVAKKPSPRGSPNARTVLKSKSSHALAFPKQFEASISKEEMATKNKIVEAYFGGAKSPQTVKDAKKRSINRIKTSEKVSVSRTEKVETTKETFSDGPLTKTQVTTRVTSQQITKKQMSPFAKFRQLDKQNSLNTPPSTPKTPTSGGPLFKFTDPNLSRSASTIKERLLQWCQMKTKEYENIKLDNFSTSWADGLAFCALVHHFLPDAFDYHQLTPNNRRHNFTLAFQVADEKADIAPLLDVEDMVATRRPDWKCVFTYVQSIYRRFKDED